MIFKRLDETDDRVRALEDRCHTLEEGLKWREQDSGLHQEAMLREAEERYKRSCRPVGDPRASDWKRRREKQKIKINILSERS